MLESNVNDELKLLDGEATGAEPSEDVQKALREAKAKYEVAILHTESCDKHQPTALLFIVRTWPASPEVAGGRTEACTNNM